VGSKRSCEGAVNLKRVIGAEEPGREKELSTAEVDLTLGRGGGQKRDLMAWTDRFGKNVTGGVVESI